jgi:hypothetical protein
MAYEDSRCTAQICVADVNRPPEAAKILRRSNIYYQSVDLLSFRAENTGWRAPPRAALQEAMRPGGGTPFSNSCFPSPSTSGNTQVGSSW